MTTELAQIRAPATEAEARGMIASWPDLLNQPIQSQEQAHRILTEAKRLSVPTTRQWVAGRIATLLSHYFVSSVPSEMMAAIAEDWQEELAPYPSWAISRAVRWWMSADNEGRRRKPVPGDIAERAKREAGILKLAKFHAERFAPANPPESEVMITDEQRAEMQATLKRFGVKP